jgi:hypothetical protein
VGRPQRAHRPFSSDPSIDDIARFAASTSGAAFAQLCAFWGFDPGTLAEDDVIAMNIRAAFAIALTDTVEAKTEQESDAEVARRHWDGVARAKKYGDILRAAHG